MPAALKTGSRRRLQTDSTRCAGQGRCAALLPGTVLAGDGGYPIVDPEPLPPELVAQARRAVASCPQHALQLVEVKSER
jgi:ferredoxin